MICLFVSPRLWKVICKRHGAYAVRHLQARYPNAIFYILPGGLEWYPFKEVDYDPFLNVFVDKLQEEALVVAPIKPEAYVLWGCLSREIKGRVDHDEMWALAVASALAATDEPKLRYLTTRSLTGLLDIPTEIYKDVER